MWWQSEIELKAKSRGLHLVTDEVLSQIPELKNIEIGFMHLFILHTSASLAINENADPNVRKDLEYFLNKTVQENDPGYSHIEEGPDDMPAHIKALMIGTDLTLPISSGKVKLGTWQGLYLCEHRNQANKRKIVVTLNGQAYPS